MRSGVTTTRYCVVKCSIVSLAAKITPPSRTKCSRGSRQAWLTHLGSLGPPPARAFAPALALQVKGLLVSVLWAMAFSLLAETVAEGETPGARLTRNAGDQARRAGIAGAERLEILGIAGIAHPQRQVVVTVVPAHAEAQVEQAIAFDPR